MSGTGSPPAAGVAGAVAPKRWTTWLGIAALVAAVMLLWWLLTGDGPRKPAENTGAAPGVAGQVRQVAMPPPAVPAPAIPPQQAAMPPQQLPGAYGQRQAPARTQPIKPAPIMAWEAPENEARPQQADLRTGEAAEDQENSLTGRLRATRTPTSKARRMRNPAMTLAQGTMIPCIRETPINTQLPGFVRCRVPVPVVGAEPGTVTLLDAGTVLTGEVQRAMMHGTDRAFILWTRARTPDGVLVELASPGTDALGTNGVAVDVRSNFWARFGGAIMLSFIDSGLQAAAIGASSLAGDGGGGRAVNFNSFQARGGSAAAQALNGTVNIPPFGTAPQGALEAVFTARDLDFSDVYSLRMR